MSTIGPTAVKRLEPAIDAADAVLLDAPVSGSVPQARDGKLSIMVGGDQRAFDRARPVLDVLGDRVLRLGELGAGAAMKLAIQTIVYGLNQSVAEGLTIAERSGIPPAMAYDIFSNSAITSPFILNRRDEFLRPEVQPVSSGLTSR